MSKLLRLAIAAIAAVAGSLVVLPGVAQASLSADVSFVFPSATVTVGQTDLPVQLSFTNNNDGLETGNVNTVCLGGEANPPCDDIAGGTPADDKGINMLMSCGSPGLSTCGVGGEDPGVFTAEAVGVGGGACAGTDFDIVVSDATYGTLRFEPQGGGPLTLAQDETCTIDFEVDVTALPLLDQDPGTAGQQTGLIADVLMYSASLDAYDSDSSIVTVSRAVPAINTQASPAVALGAGTLTDTATVSGRAFPDETGTVTFRLYGPDDDTCSAAPVFESTVPITSTVNQVTSGAFTPTEVGTYRWIASYSGDRNNDPVAGACNDDNESVVVNRGETALVTAASDDLLLGGGTLTDTATLTSSSSSITGIVSFSLFGPDDADCSGPAIFTSDVALASGATSATSEPYTPTAPGTYRWVASYAGDANNLPVAGECNDPGESTLVEPAQPALVTDAGDDAVVGDALTDTATVTGRVLAGDATLDFRLYGPDDDDCSGTPVFEQLGVEFGAADDSVSSDPYTASDPGTYRWVVEYSGDANNEGAVGDCGDPTETVDVLRGAPTIVTEASPSVPVNVGQLSDAATVTGRASPQAGATVSFRLYGPGDTDCSGTPVFEDLDVAYPVSGGAVRSATYTPTVVGTYRWVASYSGDANNLPAIGTCGDPAETVSVTAAPTQELPATGSATDLLMRVGALTLLAGIGLLATGRRRRIA